MSDTDKELEELLKQVLSDDESEVKEEVEIEEPVNEEEQAEETEEAVLEEEAPAELEIDPDALKSFVEEIETAKEPGLKEKLQEQALELQEYERVVNSYNPRGTLPQKDYKGKLIYDLSRDELDAYLTELQDAGQMAEYNEATDAIRAFKENQVLLQKARNELILKQQDHQQEVQTVEWFDVRDEFLSKVPLLKEFQQTIEAAIDKRMVSDAQFAQKTLTRSGKEWAVREVLKSEGVIDQLKKKLPAADASPSVPDASIKGKKVEPQKANNKKIWTQAEIEKLAKSGEYAKYEAQIDQAALEGRLSA